MKKPNIHASSKHSSISSQKSSPKWGREEETEIFAQKVKLFRQGKLSEDDFRRFRLQHGAYGSRLHMNYSMVRIKVPSGEITPEQLEKIASLSEAFSIGSAHVSTRQNIQLHWVQLEDVSEVMRGLVEVGLTTREACGNTVRNVMCSHLAGVCPDEAFDATPYAKAIAQFFIRNPMCQNLPRKFKINFGCCDKHGLIRIADIGLLGSSINVRFLQYIILRSTKPYISYGRGDVGIYTRKQRQNLPACYILRSRSKVPLSQ